MTWLALVFPRLVLEWCGRGTEPTAPRVLLDRQHKVLQCDQTAEQAGIRAGMSLATLLVLNDQVQLLAESELPGGSVQSTERAALDALALWAGDFAAQIWRVPADGLLLEIGSMLRLFGGLEGYLRQLRQALQQQGFEWQWAIGNSQRAAITLAQAGIEWLSPDHQATRRQLQQLPLASLRWSPAQKSALARLGLHQLGALLQLPTAQVRRRLGAPLLTWLLELEGRLSPALPRFQPAPQFQLSQPLLAEICHVHGLLFPLRRLLEALANYLRQRQLATTECWLTLVHRQLPATQLKLIAAQPEASLREWLQLSQWQLEKLRLAAPVIAITLGCQQLVAQRPHSADLLTSRAGDRLSRGQLLGRLQSRLGEQGLFGLRLTGDPRPEYAGCRAHPASAGLSEEGRRQHAELSAVGRRRPSWLLAQPRALAERDLRIIDGPERICSGWWQSAAGAEVIRDYYLARDRHGALCWIFKDQQGGWFLHGWFG